MVIRCVVRTIKRRARVSNPHRPAVQPWIEVDRTTSVAPIVPKPTRHAPMRVARGLLAALLALVPLSPSAQPATPLAQPNLDLYFSGTIRAVLALSDGSVVVGGAFTTVFDSASQLNIPRRNLAKLAPNGALDLAWQGDTNGEVFALARMPDGSIVAGGNFTSIGGLARVGIAKLSGATGAADAAWNAASNGAAAAIAVGSDGSVYAGGVFNTVGGQTRRGLAKLSGATGAVDLLWNPAPSSGGSLSYEDALIDGGFVYFAGSFDRSGGGCCLARFPTTGSGSIDGSWMPGLSGTPVSDLALDASGRLIVAGEFTSLQGQPRNRIARISSAGAVDSWDPNASGIVLAVSLDGAGNVYAGGLFTSIGGLSRPRFAKLSETTGVADPSFSVAFDGGVRDIAIDAAGVVIAGGSFNTRQGEAALSLARVQANGTALQTPFVQSTGAVYAVLQTSDGTYVGGRFARANGERRNNLLRLLNNGAIDPGWSPRTDCPTGRCVTTLAVDGSGNVYAGGSFYSANDVPRVGLAKFDRNGSLLGWSPNVAGGCPIGIDDACVYALAVAADGTAFAGGGSTFIPGFLRKISPDGSIDGTWLPATGTVRALRFDPGGGLLVGGSFATIAGVSRSGIARISTTSPVTADAAFAPNPTGGEVSALATGPGGSIYLGGGFNSVSGQPRAGIARVSAGGVLDAAWNPGTTCVAGYSCVASITLDIVGDVFVGGSFSAIGGSPRNHLAKLSGTTGLADPRWTAPLATDAEAPFIAALDTRGDSALLVGGRYTSVSSVGRRLLAALPTSVEDLFANGFE